MTDPWGLAPPLAAGGIDVDWCERVARPRSATTRSTRRWSGSRPRSSSKTLLVELKDAVRRISELVAAVRSYSQLDRASRQRDRRPRRAREHADDARPQARGRRHRRARVRRDLPPIDAYAGELNQVWTNLIDNAVDAMDGDGTLTVRTRAEGDGVVVEIADTGPGMPPEVAARAFEPFFTTKDVGKGTGLGLDIARRIVVERHGGLIEHRLPGHGIRVRARGP